VDVALVEGPVAHQRIEALAWKDDELVVIAPPDHPLTRARSVSVQTLAAHNFIVREPGSGTREVARRALAEHGVSLRRTMRVGGTEAIKQAVAAGLGLAIVSRAAADDQLALGRIAVIAVDGLLMRREFTELRLAGRMPSAAARAFEMLLDTPPDESLADASGHPG
jgi:DNA-binding transcriptional LysR family regulator